MRGSCSAKNPSPRRASFGIASKVFLALALLGVEVLGLLRVHRCDSGLIQLRMKISPS